MKYYTPVYFFHIPVKRQKRPNEPPEGDYKELRGLAFVDTENTVSLEEVLPAVRAAFAPSHNGSQPFFALLSQAGNAWFATGGFHARSAGDWEPHKVLHVFDDLYSEHPPRVVDLEDEAFDTCVSLFRMAGGCPCPLATAYTRDEEGMSGMATYGCGVERVWPLVRKTPYSGRDADTLLKRARLPDTFPRIVGEYAYMPRRWLLNETFAASECFHEELVEPDMEAIEKQREQLRENSKLAATTRTFRKTECAPCEFPKCTAWRTHRCTGQKTVEDIRRHNGDAEMFFSGFTVEQRNALMRSSVNYRHLDAYGLNSQYKRIANLGFFTESGAFRVFSAARKTRCESVDVRSWDALVALVPELKQWDLEAHARGGISEEALRIYAHISRKKWVRRLVNMHGWLSYDLLGIWVRDGYGASTPQRVCYVYGGYGNLGEIKADGSDEAALFKLLSGDEEGAVIPTKIG